MPYAKRIVTPIRLSDKPLSKEDWFDFTAVSNNTLVGAIQQLSSLAVHASDLFSELEEEFTSTYERTISLTNRITRLQETTENLNARAVTVPVGDLTSFTKVEDHFKVHYGFDTGLFSKASRPESVKESYEMAEHNPISIIRQANRHRDDGWSGSKIFSLAPVVVDNKVKHEDVEMVAEIKRPLSTITFERETKQVKYRRRPHSTDGLHRLHTEANTNILLPTPNTKQRRMAESQPAITVEVDVTGSNFDRMCSFRESLRSIDREYVDVKLTKKQLKRRRRLTIGGIPSPVMHELENDEEENSRSLERKRDRRKTVEVDVSFPLDAVIYANRRIPDSDVVSKKSSMEYLDGTHERKKKGFRQTIRDTVQNIRGRRSLSVPKFMKSSSKETVKKSNLPKSATTGNIKSDCEKYSAPDGKLYAGIHKRKSNLIRSKSFSGSRDRNHLWLRPQSQELVPVSIPDICRTSTSTISTAISEPTMISGTSEETVEPMETPDSVSISTTSSNRKLHVPFSLARLVSVVKLRDSKKRVPKEDRQSSSGNWSGSSSSARQSIESDLRRNSSPEKRWSEAESDKSSKDSALSLDDYPPSTNSRATSETNETEETSTIVGDNDSIATTSTLCNNAFNNFTNLPSKEWLDSLERAHEQLVGQPVLSLQNLQAHDAQFREPPEDDGRDDERSSTYSMDTEGFYTSMHTDSGVTKRLSELTKPGMPLDLKPRRRKKRTRSKEQSSSTSTTSVDSVVKKPAANAAQPTTTQKKVRGPPPQPPRRASSVSSVKTEPRAKAKKLPAFCSTESEAETIYARLKQKTWVSSNNAFPSLCNITPEQSEDEDEALSSLIKEHKSHVVLSAIKDSPHHDNSVIASPPPSMPLMKHLSIDDSRIPIGERSTRVKRGLYALTNGRSTLPRDFKPSLYAKEMAEQMEKNESTEFSNSWPKLPSEKKEEPNKLIGILKSPDRYEPSKPPKTLNFGPTVNMYGDSHPPQRKVLPSPSTPDYIGSRLPMAVENTFSCYEEQQTLKTIGEVPEPVYVCNQPVVFSKEKVPVKYQHQIKVTPGPRVAEAPKPGKKPSSGLLWKKNKPSEGKNPLYANLAGNNPAAAKRLSVHYASCPIAPGSKQMAPPETDDDTPVSNGVPSSMCKLGTTPSVTDVSPYNSLQRQGSIAACPMPNCSHNHHHKLHSHPSVPSTTTTSTYATLYSATTIPSTCSTASAIIETVPVVVNAGKASQDKQSPAAQPVILSTFQRGTSLRRSTTPSAPRPPGTFPRSSSLVHSAPCTPLEHTPPSAIHKVPSGGSIENNSRSSLRSSSSSSLKSSSSVGSQGAMKRQTPSPVAAVPAKLVITTAARPSSLALSSVYQPPETVLPPGDIKPQRATPATPQTSCSSLVTAPTVTSSGPAATTTMVNGVFKFSATQAATSTTPTTTPTVSFAAVKSLAQDLKSERPATVSENKVSSSSSLGSIKSTTAVSTLTSQPATISSSKTTGTVTSSGQTATSNISSTSTTSLVKGSISHTSSNTASSTSVGVSKHQSQATTTTASSTKTPPTNKVGHTPSQDSKVEPKTTTFPVTSTTSSKSATKVEVKKEEKIEKSGSIKKEQQAKEHGCLESKKVVKVVDQEGEKKMENDQVKRIEDISAENAALVGLLKEAKPSEVITMTTGIITEGESTPATPATPTGAAKGDSPKEGKTNTSPPVSGTSSPTTRSLRTMMSPKPYGYKSSPTREHKPLITMSRDDLFKSIHARQSESDKSPVSSPPASPPMNPSTETVKKVTTAPPVKNGIGPSKVTANTSKEDFKKLLEQHGKEKASPSVKSPSSVSLTSTSTTNGVVSSRRKAWETAGINKSVENGCSKQNGVVQSTPAKATSPVTNTKQNGPLSGKATSPVTNGKQNGHLNGTSAHVGSIHSKSNVVIPVSGTNSTQQLRSAMHSAKMKYLSGELNQSSQPQPTGQQNGIISNTSLAPQARPKTLPCTSSTSAQRRRGAQTQIKHDVINTPIYEDKQEGTNPVPETKVSNFSSKNGTSSVGGMSRASTLVERNNTRHWSTQGKTGVPVDETTVLSILDSIKSSLTIINGKHTSLPVTRRLAAPKETAM